MHGEVNAVDVVKKGSTNQPNDLTKIKYFDNNYINNLKTVLLIVLFYI